MEIVHVTKSKHLKSIKKLGLLRSKPLLEHHDKLLREEFDDYDPEIGTIYAWAEHLDNERFLRDLAYWDVWGKPRNVALTDVPYERYLNMLEDGPEVFDFIDKRGYQSELYVALLIEVPYNPLHDRFFHRQDRGMSSIWGNMDTRYEHSDKPMVFINKPIPSASIKGIIATANTEIKRNNRIDVHTDMTTRRFE